jgi:Fibronectin type III domain.
VNFIPPTITVSINQSETSINITWLPYHRFHWNSDQLLSYVVYYEEVVPELDYNMTLYRNKLEMDNITTTALLEDLKAFTNYSIYVTTVNNIGIGYGAHTFCRTKETGKYAGIIYAEGQHKLKTFKQRHNNVILQKLNLGGNKKG